MKFIHGRATGFAQKPYSMIDDRTGEPKSGITRTLLVADGEDADRIKLRDEFWNTLPQPVQEYLANLGVAGFGSEVLASFVDGFQGKGKNCTGLRIVTTEGEVVVDTIGTLLSV